MLSPFTHAWSTINVAGRRILASSIHFMSGRNIGPSGHWSHSNANLECSRKSTEVSFETNQTSSPRRTWNFVILSRFNLWPKT